MDAANASDPDGHTAGDSTTPPRNRAMPGRGRRVEAIEVARYYLRCELPNIMPTADNPDTVDAIEAGLRALSPDEVWRLLEAVSFRFRLNPVFTAVSDQGLVWDEVVLPLEAIVMTGVMPSVDDVVYSKTIGRDPTRFVAFLDDYYRQHPASDPLGLDTFRPLGGPVQLDALLV